VRQRAAVPVYRMFIMAHTRMFTITTHTEEHADSILAVKMRRRAVIDTDLTPAHNYCMQLQAYNANQTPAFSIASASHVCMCTVI
jgi:uncharacterized protein YccT (UPF0319 family)